MARISPSHLGLAVATYVEQDMYPQAKGFDKVFLAAAVLALPNKAHKMVDRVLFIVIVLFVLFHNSHPTMAVLDVAILYATQSVVQLTTDRTRLTILGDDIRAFLFEVVDALNG